MHTSLFAYWPALDGRRADTGAQVPVLNARKPHPNDITMAASLVSYINDLSFPGSVRPAIRPV